MTYGWVDGVGTAARIGSIEHLAIDSLGNIYFSDWNTVRRLSPAGVVSPVPGLSSGVFNSTDGLVVSSTGLLFVVDRSRHVIIKIDLTGAATIFAGAADLSGSADGDGAAARFYLPNNITIDGFDNLYVTDAQNYTIRKITAAGTVSTLAGAPGQGGLLDGTGPTARFGFITGICADDAGNVFVTDYSTIRKITAAGVVTTMAGVAGVSGNTDSLSGGSGALFNEPRGVATDRHGNIYVADTKNSTIRKISSSGSVATIAGSPSSGSTDGPAGAARFSGPRGVAVDSAGSGYVADQFNSEIRKISSSGMVTTFAAGVSWPMSVAAGTDDQIYVADYNAIRKVTTTGVLSTVAGVSANLLDPTGVAVDRAGTMYVADRGNQTIRKITAGGVVSILAGATGVAGNADLVGGYARFNNPSDVAVDATGNVYVADSNNCTLRKITPDGSATTLAGSPGIQGNADGQGATARFRFPTGLAIDATGAIYVADYGNNTIRFVTSGGAVTTLAGYVGLSGGGATDPTSHGATDGAGQNARFDAPTHVAVDPAGNVYVADGGNNTVRKGIPIYLQTITWPTPQAIDYGTVLSNTQLNAISNIAGIFSYSPAVGTVLDGGTQTLTATFIPTDLVSYPGATSQTTTIVVNPAVPPITWTRPESIIYGTTLSATQLSATASVPGTWLYTPAIGTVLHVGAGQILTSTFSPTDSLNYKGISTSQTILVTKAPLMATAVDKSKIQGADNPGLTIKYTGFVNGDTAAVLNSPPTAATAATVSSTVGTYAINLNGGTAADYSFSYTLGSLTVATAPVAPILTNAGSATFTTGKAGSFTFIASGTPVPSFSVKGLPAWASLNPTTGELTGIPDPSATAFPMVVTASNGTAPDASQSFTLNILSIANFAGTYFGTFTGDRGRWALRVNQDGTAVYIAYLTPRRSMFVVQLTVKADGRFAVTGTESVPLIRGNDLRTLSSGVSQPGKQQATASNFTLTGQITAGVVTGEVAGLGEIFSGSVDALAGSVTGGYYSAAAQMSTGTTYVIVAPSGQAFAVAVTPTAIEAAIGNLRSNGQLTATTQAGGQLSLSINAAAKSMAVVFTPAGASTPINFGAATGEPPTGSRLVNLSVRSRAGNDDKTLIMGFVIAGPGTKHVLVRGLGPVLAKYGVSDWLADPQLKFFSGTTEVDQNDNWSDSLSQAFVTLGALPLPSGSKDSAMLRASAAGVFSVQVASPDTTTGIALAEVYDADKTGARLVNVSARAEALSGDGILVAGFVLEGTGPKTLLIRGLGPTLGPLGVAGFLVDPQLTVFSQASEELARNDDWGGTADLKAMFTQLGAVPLLSDSSKDAALLITLQPGVYTVHVSGVNNTTGVALVEVYEVP